MPGRASDVNLVCASSLAWGAQRGSIHAQNESIDPRPRRIQLRCHWTDVSIAVVRRGLTCSNNAAQMGCIILQSSSFITREWACSKSAPLSPTQSMVLYRLITRCQSEMSCVMACVEITLFRPGVLAVKSDNPRFGSRMGLLATW